SRGRQHPYRGELSPFLGRSTTTPTSTSTFCSVPSPAFPSAACSTRAISASEDRFQHRRKHCEPCLSRAQPAEGSASCRSGTGWSATAEGWELAAVHARCLH